MIPLNQVTVIGPDVVVISGREAIVSVKDVPQIQTVLEHKLLLKGTCIITRMVATLALLSISTLTSRQAALRGTKPQVGYYLRLASNPCPRGGSSAPFKESSSGFL